MPIYQISPTKWTNKPPQEPRARSSLPTPYIISDEMPLTEQVDGRFYSSKSAFRAVGRKLGLTEVGNSAFPKRQRPSSLPEAKTARVTAVRKAIAQYKSGVRPKGE